MSSRFCGIVALEAIIIIAHILGSNRLSSLVLWEQLGVKSEDLVRVKVWKIKSFAMLDSKMRHVKCYQVL